ncbi:hypothetical protein GALMADRAFT_230824 [Galerina marginata CBS 339.88]|uniref:Large ribosomal subunit protein mL54 n=1 Tax=Galerina marginata (strain CBS 339.88) TaxID=685588 RepID=A0A067SEK8_GALM3|nr:hypothetical protein GALMADRAFT_230824 [Galerina marginata CBS 339.88]
MSLLLPLRRRPTSTFAVLRVRSACKRGYATDTPSKGTKKAAPTSSNASPSSAPTSLTATAATTRSSCLPSTLLKGANYLKGQPPVLALEDSAYPEWLWDTLKPRVYEDDGPGGKKERMERRVANRQAIKDRNFMQTQ